MEYLMIMILLISVFNSWLLLKLHNKRTPDVDSKLLQEQIKNLKKIVRLNEKYIKTIKEEQNNEKMAESKQQEDMVQIDRRIY